MALTFIPMSVMCGSTSRDIIWYSFMFPFCPFLSTRVVSLWLYAFMVTPFPLANGSPLPVSMQMVSLCIFIGDCSDSSLIRYTLR